MISKAITWRGCCLFLVALCVSGCDRNESPQSKPLQTHEIDDPNPCATQSERGKNSSALKWKTAMSELQTANPERRDEIVVRVWSEELMSLDKQLGVPEFAVDREGLDQIPREAFIPESNQVTQEAQGRLILLASVASASGPESLFALFESRADSVPATWADVAALRAVEESLEDLVVEDPRSARTLACGYLHARNPVYRYLALASTAYMAPSEESTKEGRHDIYEALFPFYTKLTADPDGLVQNKAFLLMGTLGSNEGLEFLQNQFELASSDADPRRKLAIRRALEINRSLLASQARSDGDR